MKTSCVKRKTRTYMPPLNENTDKISGTNAFPASFNCVAIESRAIHRASFWSQNNIEQRLRTKWKYGGEGGIVNVRIFTVKFIPRLTLQVSQQF